MVTCRRQVSIADSVKVVRRARSVGLKRPLESCYMVLEGGACRKARSKRGKGLAVRAVEAGLVEA